MGTSNAVTVYVCAYPFRVEREQIYPALRADEIDSCKDARVRESKYFVWKLLEKAIFEQYGLHIESLDFAKTSGKWTCPAFHFSLSHSGSLVCVALSDRPVGVDVERKNAARFHPALRKKILTPRESEEEEGLQEEERALRANALWTKKEAVFKMRGGSIFHPQTVETDIPTQTVTVEGSDGAYFLSVAAEELTEINLISL